MNFGKQLKEGLITQNPVLVQVLGMCSMPLGSVRYQDGAAAGWNGQYWLAARDGDGKRYLH